MDVGAPGAGATRRARFATRASRTGDARREAVEGGLHDLRDLR